MKKLLFIFILIMSTSLLAETSNLKRLENFSNNLKSLAADFTQTLQLESGEITEINSGQMWLEKPLQFRWDYYYPYEQNVVADGKSLWIYEKDLDQVIIKDVGIALAKAPISILSENEPLSDDFTVTALEAMDGMEWFLLEPKEEDNDFQYIYLGFGEHSLEIMELHDQFGQISRIIFDNLAVNPIIDKKLFHFTIPSKVDIIDERS